ncbi:MAG TPA: phosphotransferase [Acidimicrobiia bacterium]|jgi:aminoglycoside phosphotransferase (APT) family kinase protein
MSTETRDRGRWSIPVDEDAALATMRVVASGLGLPVDDPVVLQRSNNVVVWLRPAPVVVKVMRSTPERAAAARQLEIACHCAARGAPVSVPSDQVPCEVSGDTRHDVTFWRHEPTVSREREPDEVAAALLALHRALDTLPGPVPRLADLHVDVCSILADDAQMAALDPGTRARLRERFAALLKELTTCDTDERVLHGEVHSGNTLVVEQGVRFCDFEGVCRGPLEWDLAYLPDACMGAFVGVDPERVRLLRQVVSARVATLCWAKLRAVDDPVERWHAEHHLAIALGGDRSEVAAP